MFDKLVQFNTKLKEDLARKGYVRNDVEIFNAKVNIYLVIAFENRLKKKPFKITKISRMTQEDYDMVLNSAIRMIDNHRSSYD